MALTQAQIILWLQQCAQLFEQNSDYLTDLDREIGDADHGLNMNRGFRKVQEKLPEFDGQDIGTILKTTGMTLLSNIGGASGPLFGTFFIRAAKPTASLQNLELNQLVEMVTEGVAGIVSRGKAEPNDKTMCDVWWPVVESLKQSNEQNLSIKEALNQAQIVAEKAAENTIPMQARKGRASYLGERSIGHKDPGSASVVLMIQALANSINA
ncbi:dihydroxyacetone kinase ADP-binding subunit DhaL [Proteus cibarius]|uniref:Dihydroxyacetone kinase ADP-binding subunit DhaL n=1 Tax=Proteus terrae subsp. cibarius TaxID=626774 RepID=A0A6G6SZG4_9GAMM|nr:dihydroxyacetone kinase subunit DhaL [Proteus terrae]QHP77718.1 dihydroxyacetone kinase subunit L [Proteus vulgaris]MBG2915537.1 dihydroxyacetone kinase ADP-binding subunit DhaL [Proteus terrae subsp. cibarius]MBG3090333.1 dihydroxyacetone kinase ADP-binding subunit DhaL [Proteus terrae subsp. cibarius]MBG6038495.1 dihydroxyacetone kinase ADP-binding subunit DhaL [Proteus terrae subsp. cibarius]MCO4182251.1 dihydroxyacetone kinase ADP-binding subunit DhaL [Proteus terrae]